MYSNILQLSLSSATDIERQNSLCQLWPKIDSEEKLFEMAKTDEVVSHLAYLLKQTKLDYSKKWDIELQKIEKQVNILMSSLEEVAIKLKQQNIKIVALKNAGITKGIYKNNACSPMGDIDLLVTTNDFHRAHDIILNDLNYTFKFRSEFEKEDIVEAFKGGGTEYFKEVDGHIVWLELQWRPIAGRWIQPHNEPNGNELMNRSLSLEDSSVRILAPEDNLLQVALHTAKHSYVRAPGFRLHSDVDRIVRYQTINWELFEKTVLKLKLKTAVYFSLYFAHELLETPIPESIFIDLKPVWYRKNIILHYIKKAGIFNQRKKKFTKVGYIIFNLALYDSLSENFKAVFPPFESLKIKYDIRHKYQMPYYHIKRINDLIFKRAKL